MYLVAEKCRALSVLALVSPLTFGLQGRVPILFLDQNDGPMHGAGSDWLVAELGGERLQKTVAAVRGYRTAGGVDLVKFGIG
jgi:hypothetical protein